MKNSKKKISIIGCGYVGSSMAALLSQFNTVVAIDTDMDKVNSINNRISPIEDKDIQNFFDNKKLDLYASSKINACKDSEYIVIAVPTDYDEDIEFFNTGILDKVLADVSLLNPDAAIIIKSTVPIGYTENAKILFSNNNIFFSPEFFLSKSKRRSCITVPLLLTQRNYILHFFLSFQKCCQYHHHATP